MGTVTVSITVEDDILRQIDDLVKRGKFKNRSTAFKEAVILMMKQRFQDRKTLREELSRSIMQKDLRTAEEVFDEIRREEDEDIS